MKWLCLWLVLEFFTNVDSVLVSVEQGILRGSIASRTTGNGVYYSFKGIPYAAPPVGKLRFRDPQTPLSWNGVRNATEHGSICPQLVLFTQEFLPGDEDCLFLNVYTPSIEPSCPLPVMFYIHGGLFYSGSGNSNDYGPSFLLDQNAIVVTFNFRQSVLGFLGLNIKQAPGNAGLKDQVAALRWVKRNIAKFGGDPENVTIFGTSSGGTSVLLHNVSPLSKGYFKRAIAMSSHYTSQLAFQPVEQALLLSQKLGFYSTNHEEVFNFLQNASVKSLVTTNVNVTLSDQVKGINPFLPMIEKDLGGHHFLTKDPQSLLINGELNVDEIILGHTTQESVLVVDVQLDRILNYYPYYRELLVPSDIYSTHSLKTSVRLGELVYEYFIGHKEISQDNIKYFLRLYSYLKYDIEIYRYAEMWAKTKNKIYLYRFDVFTERNLFGKRGLMFGIENATHGDDAFYLFDNTELAINKDQPSYEAIIKITKLVSNFAKYGNPTPDNSLNVTWNDFSFERSFLAIDDQLTCLHIDSKTEKDLNFWRSIYKKSSMKFS